MGKIICWLSLFFCGLSVAGTPIEQLKNLNASSFILLASTHQEMRSFRADTPYIPASTTKIITAWLALKHWGSDHRFTTSVYIDSAEKTLWIKGGGDPFLVSEELHVLAQKLSPLLKTGISTIALDVSLYEADLVAPGAGKTDNPYDAVPTAIASNFNTLNLKQVNGKLESAEPQTPLTPYARTFARKITGASLRINTGHNSRQSERYFAELLRELLRNEGMTIGDTITWGSAPDRTPDLIHENSRTLSDILQLMLKYSTNFIANEVVLTLVAEHYQKPANFTLVQDYMNSALFKHFNWKDFNFEEGAGLSPANRISARQLSELLIEFEPWSHLMPEIKPSLFAKTGTLENVQTLAGYIRLDSGNHIFSVILNEPVDNTLASDVALELQQHR